METEDLIPPSFTLTTQQPRIDYPKIHSLPNATLILFEVPKNVRHSLVQPIRPPGKTLQASCLAANRQLRYHTP